VTILELIQKTTPFLEKAGIPTPRLDIELMLAHVLGLKRMELYLRFERKLTETELDTLRPMVRRRSLREPLQHILGVVEFCGLELAVAPQALIPRPETEILVETVAKAIGQDGQGILLDVGTGTGAIALATTTVCPGIRCVATDISEPALTLARENARKHGLHDRIEFRQGDLFQPIRPGEVFDWVTCNPPYISSEQILTLQPEVRFDPVQALDGGSDGLAMIRRLIEGAHAILKADGHLLFEIGDGQADAIGGLLPPATYKVFRLLPDLAGAPRVAALVKA